MYWIVCSDQPFTEIEKPELKDLFKLLKPEAVIPSADTIKNGIKNFFPDEHCCLRNLLEVGF